MSAEGIDTGQGQAGRSAPTVQITALFWSGSCSQPQDSGTVKLCSVVHGHTTLQ